VLFGRYFLATDVLCLQRYSSSLMFQALMNMGFRSIYS